VLDRRKVLPRIKSPVRTEVVDEERLAQAIVRRHLRDAARETSFVMRFLGVGATACIGLRCHRNRNGAHERKRPAD
jgi:hypothetical protein